MTTNRLRLMLRKPQSSLNARNALPLRVMYVPVLADTKELIGVGDGMKVGALSVEEKRVWLPDFVQHLDTGSQFSDVAVGNKSQSRVAPVLAKIAIH